VVAVHEDLLAAWRAQRHVQHGAILGGVDALAAEHRRDAALEVARRGQRAQQAQGIVVDALLGVVVVQARSLGHQALAALRVGGEQLAQVAGLKLVAVLLQGLPLGQQGEVGAAHRATGSLPLAASAACLSAMRCSSCFHDFTKASAPSSCSFFASASRSTPALAIFASTASASPPSTGSTAPGLPWSATACKVFSGMVSTVSGAASASTYSVSEAFGSLVPVEAQSRRCGRAPAAASFSQRGEASSSR